MQHKIEWVDLGREPQCELDPDYPQGKDVGLLGMESELHCCLVELPYPAKRCGYYEVTCRVCKTKVAVTTAGRPDDPRSVTMGCQDVGQYRSTAEH